MEIFNSTTSLVIMMLYATGSFVGGALWLAQGILIMRDNELRTQFNYSLLDVLMSLIYGIVASWVGVFVLWRTTRG